MDRRDIHNILQQLKSGDISLSEAEQALYLAPLADLGYAIVDHQRSLRQGVSEVIYGAGKTAKQISGIVQEMLAAGDKRIIITRIEHEQALQVQELLAEACDEAQAISGQAFASVMGASFPPVFSYYDSPRLATIGLPPTPDGVGTILVAAAGTSDIAVAEEAALTAEMLGNKVERLYDVGIAGLHRLLAHATKLASASVVIAVAGMEGALPSVIGGLVACPVIAVPTSVGYGASLGGVAALLGMLNSCASGVSVVNIDNGFGAAYQASLINHPII